MINTANGYNTLLNFQKVINKWAADFDTRKLILKLNLNEI